MHPEKNHDKFNKSFKLFNFEAFEGFEDLTHLTVCMSNNSESFPESILKDIDINLPNLQSLSLNFELKATKWTADILCRLTKLQTLFSKRESQIKSVRRWFKQFYTDLYY